MTTRTYDVTGMTCEHCVHAVRTELSELHGVEDVDVVLVPDGTSTITVTSADPLSEGDVAEALDEAGDYRLVGTR